MKSVEKASVIGIVFALIVILTGIVLMGKNSAELLVTSQADKLTDISETASKSDLAPYVEQQIYGSELLAGIKSNIQDFNFIVHVYSYEKEPVEEGSDKYQHVMEEIIMPRNNTSMLSVMQDFTTKKWVNPHALFSGEYLYNKHQEVIGVEFYQKSPYEMVDVSTYADGSVASSLENAASEFIKEYIKATEETNKTVLANDDWIIPYERKTYDLYRKYGTFLVGSAQRLNDIYNSINNTSNLSSSIIADNKCLLTYFDLAEVNGLKTTGDFSYRLMGTLMTPQELRDSYPWESGVSDKYAGFNFIKTTSASYPYYVLKNWSDSTKVYDTYGLRDLQMYFPKAVKDYSDGAGGYNYNDIKFSCSGTQPAWLNDIAWQSVSKGYLFNEADKKLFDLGRFFNSRGLTSVAANDETFLFGWQGGKKKKIVVSDGLVLQKLNQNTNTIQTTTATLIEYHRFSTILRAQLDLIKNSKYEDTDRGIYDIDVESKAELEWAIGEIERIVQGTDNVNSNDPADYGLVYTKENLKVIYNHLIELNKDVVYLENFCRVTNDVGNTNLFPNVIEYIAGDVKNHNCTKGANCDIKTQLEDISDSYTELSTWNSKVYTLCKTTLEPYIDNSLRLIASMINTTEVTGKTSTDNNYNDFIDVLIDELLAKQNEYKIRLQLLGE